MLVLNRKLDEAVVIDETTVVTVLEVKGNRVKLGFVTDETVNIRLQEKPPRIREACPPARLRPLAPKLRALGYE